MEIKEKCCGNCYYFGNESSEGNGWCGLYDWLTGCNMYCDEWEQKELSMKNIGKNENRTT